MEKDRIIWSIIILGLTAPIFGCQEPLPFEDVGENTQAMSLERSEASRNTERPVFERIDSNTSPLPEEDTEDPVDDPVPPIEEGCEASERGRLEVTCRDAFGARRCEAEIWVDGELWHDGAGTVIDLEPPLGCGFDLVTRPDVVGGTAHRVSDLVLEEDCEGPCVEDVEFEVGRLAVRAFDRRWRPVSGVAWVYPVDYETDRPTPLPVGTIGLNDRHRYIEAERTYEIRIHRSGRTLARRVTVRSGRPHRLTFRWE